MLAAPTSPPPNPAPSAGVVLSEAKVDKSAEAGITALEQLLRFGPDPAPEAALPRRVRCLHLQWQRCHGRLQRRV